MKRLIPLCIMVSILIPAVTYSESYFYALTDGAIYDSIHSGQIVKTFKKGDILVAAYGEEDNFLLVYDSGGALEKLGYVSMRSGFRFSASNDHEIAEGIKNKMEEIKRAEETKRKIAKETEIKEAELKRREKEFKEQKFKSAIDGFCGLKWGGSKDDLIWRIDPNAYGTLIDDDSISFSSQDFNPRKPNSRNEWEKIGEAPVTKYCFKFYKNRFYWAYVRFPKHESFDIFLNALTMKYGKAQSVTPLVLKINPNATIGKQHSWTIENKVRIDLSYNNMEQGGINGTLDYSYLPIWNEINKRDQTRAKKTKDSL